MCDFIIFTSDGSEDIELVSTIDVLKRAGANIKLCAVSPKVDDFVTLANGTRLLFDCKFEELDVDKNDYKGLVLPGGSKGTNSFCSSNKLIDFVKESFSKKKLISAICAAPLVLDKAGVLEGKKYTCYPSVSSKIQAKNATFISNQKVVTDDNLITSQGPGTAIIFALELVEYLYGSSLRQKLASDLLVN